jgi:esterase/lipase superfamily enzyme
VKYLTKMLVSFFSIRWGLFYLILYGTYLFLQLYVQKGGTILEYILLGFISVSLGLWSPTVRWFLRLIAFQSYAFFFIFWYCLSHYCFLFTPISQLTDYFIFSVLNMYNNADRYIPLATATAGLVVITVIFWLIYPYVLRALSRCAGRVSPKIIAPDPETGTRRRYEIRQKAWFADPYTCVFEGPLRRGRPHGWGVWIDTSFQGELMTGYWYKGIPVGPFQSIENDTRNMLVNLRIIYASNSGGRWSLTRTPLTMGVACIEACVSGSFFKGYPIVKMVTQPKECACPKNSCGCVSEIFRKKHYRHFDDERVITSVSVTVDKRFNTLSVTGFQPRSDQERAITIQLAESNGQIALGVDERWLSSKSREGLLFIHGMYHTLEDSLKRFGQFLALGHFPAYIKPLCFNWPSSAGPWLYWCAHNVASDNDNHRDFKKFLKSVHASGIRTLHVMCHSMGSRMFLRSFNTISELFKPRKLESNGLSGPGSHGIGTLAAAEAASVGGSDPDTVWKRGGLNDDGLELKNLILLNPDYEVETFKHDHDELAHYCPNITVYADRRDMALKLAFRINQKASLGSNTEPLLDDSGNPLDLDIVDTGDLDRNVNGQFHGYFNINRVMVDDLHDLIVTGKRADDRTSRLKPYGKIYRFTMVPSSVVLV